MKRTKSGMLVLSAFVAIAATDVAAQDESASRPGARGTPGIEAIMRMRDRLELTADQVADLDELRRAAVERRTAQMTEMAELRSQLAAGQVRRSDLMAYMEERRDANEGVAEQERQLLDEILTDTQRTTLQETVGRRRGFARGQANPRRGGRFGFGRGGGDFRGSRSGVRRGGGGFGPGQPPGGGARPGAGPGRFGVDRGGLGVGRGGFLGRDGRGAYRGGHRTGRRWIR